MILMRTDWRKDIAPHLRSGGYWLPVPRLRRSRAAGGLGGLGSLGCSGEAEVEHQRDGRGVAGLGGVADCAALGVGEPADQTGTAGQVSPCPGLAGVQARGQEPFGVARGQEPFGVARGQEPFGVGRVVTGPVAAQRPGRLTRPWNWSR
jgi:hypothetical protein